MFEKKEEAPAIVGPTVGRIPSKWFEARGRFCNSWLYPSFSPKMELWAWGANNYGQLATGNFLDFFKPTKLQNVDIQCDSIVVPGGGELFFKIKCLQIMWF